MNTESSSSTPQDSSNAGSEITAQPRPPVGDIASMASATRQGKNDATPVTGEAQPLLNRYPPRRPKLHSRVYPTRPLARRLLEFLTLPPLISPWGLQLLGQSRLCIISRRPPII